MSSVLFIIRLSYPVPRGVVLTSHVRGNFTCSVCANARVSSILCNDVEVQFSRVLVLLGRARGLVWGASPHLSKGLVGLWFVVSRTDEGITEVRSSAPPTRLPLESTV